MLNSVKGFSLLRKNDEIPTIKFNFEEFTQNLQNYMHENNMQLQDVHFSNALIPLSPEAALVPASKLKNANRLSTVHQVYELPDEHPLLEGMDNREPIDPCKYILAIWTPGENAQSTEAPKSCCDSHESGKMCGMDTCFSCNNIREAESQTVRGTILIPCRMANRGSFPLNGTYFQLNEDVCGSFILIIMLGYGERGKRAYILMREGTYIPLQAPTMS